MSKRRLASWNITLEIVHYRDGWQQKPAPRDSSDLACLDQTFLVFMEFYWICVSFFFFFFLNNGCFSFSITISNLSQALCGPLDSTIYLETASRISGIAEPMASLRAEVDHFPSLHGWGYFYLASVFPGILSTSASQKGVVSSLATGFLTLCQNFPILLKMVLPFSN